MFSLSDNTVHLLQLAMLLAAGCVLIIYAPSIPPVAVLTMLSAPIGVLIGAKVTQTANNAANANNIATAEVPATVAASRPVVEPTPIIIPTTPPPHA